MSAGPTGKLVAALALLMAAAVAPAARAQEEPAAGTAQPAPPAQPEGFPLAEVTVQSEETRQQLKELEASLAVPANVGKLNDELDERVSAVKDAQRETSDRLAAEQADAKILADLERAWLLRQNDVRTLRAELTTYGSALDGVVAKLDELSKPWQATRARASEAEAESAVERADAALAQIAVVQEQAGKRVRALVDIQERVGVMAAVVNDALQEIGTAQQETRDRIFEPDTPPIWSVAISADPAEAWQRVLDGQRRDFQALATYLEERSNRVGAHLLLILGTLLLTGSLGRRLRAWSEEEPQLAETARVLRDPISVALLVGLATGGLFYPLAPAALREAMSFLMLVPALTLLPRLVDRPLRPVVYALALFYFASQLRTILSAAPLLSRTLQVAELAVAVALMLWMIRPARLRKLEDPGQIPVWLGTLVRLVGALISVALVAAVVGYTVFAQILAQGILVSAYAAALLYAVYRVLCALLSGLMHTQGARRLRAVRVADTKIHHFTSRLLRVGAFFWWLGITLEAFGIQASAAGILRAIVTADATLGSVAISLTDILLFAGVVVASFYLSRFVRFVLQEDVFPRVVLRRGVSNAVSTTVHYTILLGGFLLAVAAAGMDLSRVTLLAGAFGVGIGFGLQNIVNNFVSGLILLFERPIQVGDTIEVVGGLLGEVRRIGPRSSTVRTFDGAEVIVPNGMLISDQVINWTLSDRRRRVAVGVGVKYGTDPERVLEILREVARENETTLDDPAPLAIFMGFGDSSLDFELRCWIPRYEEGFSMRTQLLTAINAKLRDADIEIPFPQRDLHLRSVDGPAREALEEVSGSAAEQKRRFRLVPDEGEGGR